MNARFIRLSYTIIFVIIAIISLITLGITASLVSKYNKDGYPPEHTNSYRDRIRLLLVGSVWTTFFALIFQVGFQLFGHSTLWGILPHLIWVIIGFILCMIGSASLTALTDKIDCGKVADAFERCNMVKASVVTGWITTIMLFIAMLYLLMLAFKARAWGGVHKQNLYVDA